MGVAGCLLSSAAPLNLSECLERAATRSPQNVQSVLNESKAVEAQKAASASLLPQLSAVGTLSVTDNPATQLPDANSAGVILEQNLFPFSPSWVKAEQARGVAAAAHSARIEGSQDVALWVKQSYFAILNGEATLRIMDDVETESEHLLHSVLPRFSMGRAPAYDLVKVKSALAILARDRLFVQAALAGEKSQLGQALGLSATEPVHLTEVTVVPALPLEIAPETAVTQNPSLATLTAKIEASRLGIKAAEYSRYPSVTANIGADYAGTTPGSMSPGWAIGANLKLPLFTWDQLGHQIAEEQSQVAIDESILEQERQVVRAHWVQSLAEARSSLEAMRRFESLLTDTREAARAATVRYTHGANTILETTDALTLWQDTSMAERSAYFNYLSRLASLERLSGGTFRVSYEK